MELLVAVKPQYQKIIAKALKAEGLKVEENDIDFIEEENDIQELRIKQIVKSGLEIEIDTLNAKYSEN